MSKALKFLIEEKKEELKSTWIKNTFARYKTVNTRNSLSEAILRSTNKGEFKRTYPELEKFYEEVADHLKEKSNKSAKDIYYKIFQEDEIKNYMKKKEIVLIKDKDNDIRKLGFYFKNNSSRKFYFFPSEIRNQKANCNLIKYLASIDINLPYNYFKIRFNEKLEYIKLLDNVVQLKENKDQELCQQTINIIREKKLLNHYLSFAKNLFSDKKKEDYKFYLFLFPKIFDINIIIFMPFRDDIVVHNIIEENKNYPYLILFQPLEEKNYYFRVELGSIMINRKAYNLLDPKEDSDIIENIKDRYNSSNNNQPIIDYLKYQKDERNSKYLKDYDFENLNNQDIYQLLDKIKYYIYDF